MATNNPEAKRYDMSTCPEHACRVFDMQESEDGDYVEWEAYEALQAECEELRTALAESRANDRQAMAYLEAVRGIVGGDSFPEMIGRVKELQIERNGYKLALKEWLEKSEWVEENRE